MGSLPFAESNAAASGLYRKENVEHDKTPILKWTWKVDCVLTGVDELIRSVDNTARVFGLFRRADILAHTLNQLCVVEKTASQQLLAQRLYRQRTYNGCGTRYWPGWARG